MTDGLVQHALVAGPETGAVSISSEGLCTTKAAGQSTARGCTCLAGSSQAWLYLGRL